MISDINIDHRHGHTFRGSLYLSVRMNNQINVCMDDFDNDSCRWRTQQKKSNVVNVKCPKETQTHTHTASSSSWVFFSWHNRPRASISTFVPIFKNLALDFVIWVCSCGALSINEYRYRYEAIAWEKKKNFCPAIHTWVKGIERYRETQNEYRLYCYVHKNHT